MGQRQHRHAGMMEKRTKSYSPPFSRVSWAWCHALSAILIAVQSTKHRYMSASKCSLTSLVTGAEWTVLRDE